MSTDAVEGELARLTEALAEATRRRDMATLELMLGEEFTLTTGRPGHETRSRAEWLAVTRAHYVIESFAFERIEARTYGQVAVVRSRYRQTGSMDGANRNLTYLMTDVWVWRDARWQIVTRHISPLQADSA
jgi:hypothetical protein